MEKIVEMGLLYDFYGELLTDHQKKIYEAVILDDMSYSEIAVEQGISRQGAFDLIKRCNHILEEYEEKLHLVDKFLKTKEQVAKIDELAGLFHKSQNVELVDEIKNLAEQILHNT